MLTVDDMKSKTGDGKASGKSTPVSKDLEAEAIEAEEALLKGIE